MTKHSSFAHAWLKRLAPLPTAAEMRTWDAAAIALGIPEMVLMENAAQAALEVLRAERGDLAGKRIILLMGSGNNGGDAACLARRLLAHRALPLVLHTRPLRACTGVTGRHVRAARACGVPFFGLGAQPARSFARLLQGQVLQGQTPQGQTMQGHTLQSQAADGSTHSNALAEWAQAHILVDGLLGTGFRGPLRPPLAALIAAVNQWSSSCPTRFVLALDVPSGLEADSGQAAPCAVQAQATVSFQAAKPGLHLPAARAFTGRLHIKDIGIPPCVQEALPPSFRLLHELFPLPAAGLTAAPAAESFKNSYGHVLVLGGSAGLTGAAHLAARAALRSGAGLVSVAAPMALCAEIKHGLPDMMTLPLDSGFPSASCSEGINDTMGIGKAEAACTVNGAKPTDWPPSPPPPLIDLLLRCSAVVIGPGMGRSVQAAALVQAILALPKRPPAIIDADALHIVALNLLTRHDILTPHPGEAAALLHTTSQDIQARRVEAVQALCRLSPSVWVLKGAGTLLAQEGCCTLLSPYAVPNLAVGGTGDVLSGCIAALLGCLPKTEHECPSLAAAALGVCAHAEAGKMLAGSYPWRGNLASEVADALPQALATLHQHKTM